jgi:hypothetical protein
MRRDGRKDARDLPDGTSGIFSAYNLAAEMELIQQEKLVFSRRRIIGKADRQG